MKLKLVTSNFKLALDLALRDLEIKYKRSFLGWLWLLLTPLCLLGIYTIIFGKVFGIEWQTHITNKNESVGFSLPFFVGLAIYLMISDLVNSSASLFVSKRTYVVKSPFPLWVLWLANLIRVSVHGSVALFLVIGLAIIQQRLTITGVAWMLINILNIAVFMAGLSLFLVSIGPFIGDINEAIRLLMRVLFYATPITYPLSLIDEPIREWMWFNPLTNMVVPLRSAIVFGAPGPIWKIAAFSLSSIVLFFLAYWVFTRVKGVISDVV